MREAYSRATANSPKPRAKQNSSTIPVLKNGSVSVSKIENGYLVNHSGEHRGKYVSKTHFSATNPVQINKTGVRTRK